MKSLHKHLTGLASLALLSLFILLAPNQLHAAEEATFSWTANPEPLTGYKLYYKTGTSGAPYGGTGLTQGDSPISVDKAATTYTVTGLDHNETYHFVLTALNGTEESEYSTIATVGSDPAPIIMNMFLQ